MPRASAGVLLQRSLRFSSPAQCDPGDPLLISLVPSPLVLLLSARNETLNQYPPQAPHAGQSVPLKAAARLATGCSFIAGPERAGWDSLQRAAVGRNYVQMLRLGLLVKYRLARFRLGQHLVDETARGLNAACIVMMKRSTDDIIIFISSWLVWHDYSLRTNVAKYFPGCS